MMNSPSWNPLNLSCPYMPNTKTRFVCQSSVFMSEQCIYDTEAADAHENSKMKQIKLHADRESDTRQLGN